MLLRKWNELYKIKIFRTAQLKKALDEALKIDEIQLADQIRAIGFRCQHCSECCKAEFGDNTVSIFPFEIRRICEKTGLKAEDIATPAPWQDTDYEGNIHTFEWVLRKNGDCAFLNRGLCEIYECRPFICKTYPFYILDGQLAVSQCSGLGEAISSKESQKLSVLLKERCITEIKESISLLENFRGFMPRGKGSICVHDSEGEHWY